MADIPELPEVTGTTPRRGRLAAWQPLLTLVIALTAIGLAVWEGLENRRHNRLSVQPRIGGDIQPGSDGQREFLRLGIENNGLGPAVLTAYRVYIDGELQDTAGDFGTGRWQAVAAALDLEGDSATQMNARGFSAGYYLPAGEAATVFEVIRPMRAPGDSAPALFDLLDRLAIQFCYCSIYGSDCGEITLTTSDAAPQPCPH